VKIALIAGIILVGTALSGYFGYFYIMPNVTVVNASNRHVPSFTVTLPDSRLDFGSLNPDETNTIYYSIDQTDGYYSATVITTDGRQLSKTCGTVTGNEIHKRVNITLTEAQGLTCTGT
jgi:hypothetical protein